MKLNPDCIRDILLLCEEFPFLDSDLRWQEIRMRDFNKSLKYPSEEIAYHLVILEEAGLINCISVGSDDSITDIFVSRLTYNGHEFLAAIKPQSNWNKISKKIKLAGSVSLPIIQEAGAKLLSSVFLVD